MITASQPKEPGRIITFYSYKGGTGRSMAMANVGWLLAFAGKQVLMVDWDLEAPGLHRYLYPFLPDKNLSSSDGVIDFAIRVAEKAAGRTKESEDANVSPTVSAHTVTSKEGKDFSSRQSTGFVSKENSTTELSDSSLRKTLIADDLVHAATPGENGKEERGEWFIPYSNMLHYAIPVDYDFPDNGILDFIPAGRQSPSYPVRVNSFNWQLFYDRLNGHAVLEEAKKRMKDEYDYILIDSRTGVSDTAGICTVQMPDDLVICFTLNDQSIEGASNVAASVRNQRKLEVRIFPVPMRVEDAESNLRDEQKSHAKDRFTNLPDASADGSSRDKYWGESSVRYVPVYAYAEVLACFRDDPNETDTMLQAMRRITTLITGVDASNLPVLEKRERLQQLAKFGSAWQEQEQPLTPALSAQLQSIYWSSDDHDREMVENISRHAGADRKQMDRNVVGRDGRWMDKVFAAIRQCRRFVVFIGPHGLNVWQKYEIAMATDHIAKLAVSGRQFSIIAVLLPGFAAENVPLLVARYPTIEFQYTMDEKAIAIFTEREEIERSVNQFCPYAGLHAYREEDSCLFFGRELLVDELVDCVRHFPFVVVTGESESGKTSLVRAGLLPKLRLPNATGEKWKILSCSIGNKPFEILGATLIGALSPGLPDSEKGDHTDRLASALSVTRGEPSLVLKSRIASILRTPPLADRLLLMIDLFDEEPQQHEMLTRALQLLLEATHDEPLTLVVVASSDSNTYKTIIEKLWTNRPASRVHVPIPTGNDLRRIIEGPSRAIGLAFETGLVDRIIDDLNKASFQFSALALMLVQLWERRRDMTLTLASYEEVGGVEGAINCWVESKFSGLTTEQQVISMRLLTRIVSPDRSWRVLRLDTLDANLKLAAEWLKMVGLIGQRKNETNGAIELFLVHDRLVTGWSRLAAAIDHDQEFLAWRERIERESSIWDQLKSVGGSDTRVLRGSELDVAEGWLNQRSVDLTYREKLFITDSRSRENQRKQVEEQRIEQQEDDKEREIAAAQARRRQLTSLVLGLVLGFAAVLMASIILYNHIKSYDYLLASANGATTPSQQETAIADLTTAISKKNDDHRAYVARAALFASQSLSSQSASNDQLDKAIADYTTAASLNPSQAIQFYQMCGYLYKSVGKLDKALTEYNRILTLQQGNLQTLKDRAWVNRKLGNLDAAIADYSQILTLTPNDQQTLQDRDYVLRLLGPSVPLLQK